jgi:hypothetical protein
VIGLSAPAGAVNNNPAGNPTSPAVSYELDCAGTGAAAGSTAPFIASTVINTTTNSGAPTGTAFGAVGPAGGAISLVMSGAVVAPLNAALNPPTVGLQGDLTLGSTDGSATGTYAYTSPSMTQPNPGGQLTGVTYSSGSNQLTGGFTAADIGQIVAGSPTASPPGAGIPNGSVIINVVAGVATINTVTTGPNTAGGTTVGLAPAAGITFTDPNALATGNVFTTNGVTGHTARIGVIGASQFTLTATLAISFTPCSPSGWFGATPVGSPLLPQGTLTGYESLTAPPAGAFVNLATTPPSPNNQTVNLGEGGSGSVTLTAAAGTYPVDPNGFTLVSPSPQGSLTFSLGAGGLVSLSNTASSPEIDHILFNACDTLSGAHGGPVCSTTPGDITVNIGTPPVTQPLSEQVNAGALVLSCNSPSNYVTGNNTPTPVGNPLLQCPEFQFQPITLDGLEQQVTATTGNTTGNPSGGAPGTIYISDNRGDPNGQWSLTASFIATPVGAGSGQNPNASCGGVIAFCNSSIGLSALNTATNGAHDGQIAPNYLVVSGISCIADPLGGPAPYNPPNLNPDATPDAGGAFGSTVSLCHALQHQSGGTFLFNATYTLTIPESVYAGNYIGSVQYLVS